MKKILFIILLIIISKNVYAADDNVFYYDDEKITSMWIKKSNGTNSVLAHPYILKKRVDNSYIYCLEPFVYLKKDTPYEKVDDPSRVNLTKEQVDKINLLIYYGYGYGNHTEKKWYGVTQYLIWKLVDPVNKINFYDTSTSKEADLYRNEINEIESLVKEHVKEPNYLKKYIVNEDDTIDIDSNVDLTNYIINANVDYKIEDNHLIFSNLKEGEYNIKLTHISNRFDIDYGLYYHSKGQDVIVPGYSPIYNLEHEFSIKVVNGKFTLYKNNSITNESLEGATYGIYKDNELVDKITTNKNGIGNIELPFGIYKIKELVPPKGYKLDDNEYEIVLDENNLEAMLSLVDDKIVINIPDTYLVDKNKYFSITIFILGLIGLLYGKKYVNMH